MTRRRSNDPCWCGSARKFKRCHGDVEAARRPPVEPGPPAPLRTVPAGIGRPPYLATGGIPARGGQQVIAGAELGAMRHAGAVAAAVLLEAGAAVAPGVTTDELDEVAHDAYVRHGAYPSTLGYRGFRASVCTSVNDVACHGIPDGARLVEGDIVNIDVTAYVDGHHGDTSATFAVGRLHPVTDALVATTCAATLAGVAAVVPGRTLREIGLAVTAVADERGFGVVSDYGGHGIGAVFHAEPHVHHTPSRHATAVFVPGLCFTVEPMLTAGTHRLLQWDDGWTEVTSDRLPSAQFEHTVVVTDDGAEILTVLADGTSAVRWPNRPVVDAVDAAVDQTTDIAVDGAPLPTGR